MIWYGESCCVLALQWIETDVVVKYYGNRVLFVNDNAKGMALVGIGAMFRASSNDPFLPHLSLVVEDEGPIVAKIIGAGWV